MRMRSLFIFSILFFTWGCASHYYKTNEDLLCVYLKKPEANAVFFLCSIDRYALRSAKKIDETTWEIRVPTKLEFRYFYIIDGEPFIPDCQYKEADGFGSFNCVYVPSL